MPLAHPTSARTTSNYAQSAVAVIFALAGPGENVDDFRARIAGTGEWGQSGVGRLRVELVLTDESAGRLMELLGFTEAKKPDNN